MGTAQTGFGEIPEQLHLENRAFDTSINRGAQSIGSHGGDVPAPESRDIILGNIIAVAALSETGPIILAKDVGGSIEANLNKLATLPIFALSVSLRPVYLGLEVVALIIGYSFLVHVVVGVSQELILPCRGHEVILHCCFVVTPHRRGVPLHHHNIIRGSGGEGHEFDSDPLESREPDFQFVAGDADPT